MEIHLPVLIHIRGKIDVQISLQSVFHDNRSGQVWFVTIGTTKDVKLDEASFIKFNIPLELLLMCVGKQDPLISLLNRNGTLEMITNLDQIKWNNPPLLQEQRDVLINMKFFTSRMTPLFEYKIPNVMINQYFDTLQSMNIANEDTWKKEYATLLDYENVKRKCKIDTHNVIYNFTEKMYQIAVDMTTNTSKRDALSKPTPDLTNQISSSITSLPQLCENCNRPLHTLRTLPVMSEELMHLYLDIDVTMDDKKKYIKKHHLSGEEELNSILSSYRSAVDDLCTCYVSLPWD